MTISLRLDVEMEARLTRLAKITGRTKTFYIKQALEEKLNDLEDVYIAEQRYLERKTEREWTLEELLRGDDLAN